MTTPQLRTLALAPGRCRGIVQRECTHIACRSKSRSPYNVSRLICIGACAEKRGLKLWFTESLTGKVLNEQYMCIPTARMTLSVDTQTLYN